MKRALNYNEKKVQRGQAECIHAGNFLKDLDKLNFYSKLQRFENLISLNERTRKTNTMHISLNFDPSENLNRETSVAIANRYMNQIGFGKQPFLVYEHHDAGHPHIHIVTSTIQMSGKRIDTWNIGRLKSEPARKAIEQEFGLVQAKNRDGENASSVGPAKIEYGKFETKRSIINVLERVIKHYNYNSLATLNAILKLFNVMADQGREGGRIQKYGGLLYHVLDQNGNKIGVPVKASSIYSEPTLKNLQANFHENESKRSGLRRKLKATIDSELAKNPGDLPEMIKSLEANNIQTTVCQNESGFLYGISFIDHQNKSVFNGSEIGKAYSAMSLQKRLGKPTTSIEKTRDEGLKTQYSPLMSKKVKKLKSLRPDGVQSNNQNRTDLLHLLMKPEETASLTPYQLLRKKRKRKRGTGL